MEPVSPGVPGLRCALYPRPGRGTVCLETRSRARELGQVSVGISEQWWVPGPRWGCQELLPGRKGRGVRSGLGGLTPLPPITGLWMRREGAHPHPHPRDATGDRRPPQGFWFPPGKLIPPG